MSKSGTLSQFLSNGMKLSEPSMHTCIMTFQSTADLSYINVIYKYARNLGIR